MNLSSDLRILFSVYYWTRYGGYFAYRRYQPCLDLLLHYTTKTSLDFSTFHMATAFIRSSYCRPNHMLQIPQGLLPEDLSDMQLFCCFSSMSDFKSVTMPHDNTRPRTSCFSALARSRVGGGRRIRKLGYLARNAYSCLIMQFSN